VTRKKREGVGSKILILRKIPWTPQESPKKVRKKKGKDRREGQGKRCERQEKNHEEHSNGGTGRDLGTTRKKKKLWGNTRRREAGPEKKKKLKCLK